MKTEGTFPITLMYLVYAVFSLSIFSMFFSCFSNLFGAHVHNMDLGILTEKEVQDRTKFGYLSLECIDCGIECSFLLLFTALVFMVSNRNLPIHGEVITFLVYLIQIQVYLSFLYSSFTRLFEIHMNNRLSDIKTMGNEIQTTVKKAVNIYFRWLTVSVACVWYFIWYPFEFVLKQLLYPWFIFIAVIIKKFIIICGAALSVCWSYLSAIPVVAAIVNAGKAIGFFFVIIGVGCIYLYQKITKSLACICLPISRCCVSSFDCIVSCFTGLCGDCSMFDNLKKLTRAFKRGLHVFGEPTDHKGHFYVESQRKKFMFVRKEYDLVLGTSALRYGGEGSKKDKVALDLNEYQLVLRDSLNEPDTHHSIGTEHVHEYIFETPNSMFSVCKHRLIYHVALARIEADGHPGPHRKYFYFTADQDEKKNNKGAHTKVEVFVKTLLEHTEHVREQKRIKEEAEKARIENAENDEQDEKIIPQCVA